MMKCISLLRCLHQVEVIDKSHCSLEDVPNLQNYSRSLEELFLGANKLTTLTRPLFRLTRLRRLNVGDNIIQDIPPDIANLVHLVELDCSRNKIQHIPEQIKFLRSLQICDFSANNIEELPAGLVQLKNLTTLNLNYCLLTKLPDDFGSLKNLQSLELRENELTTLPKSFTSLENLRKLDLGQNLIRELPHDIGKLRNLEYLLVDMNNLQTLPDEIGLLENLQLLDVVKQEGAAIHPQQSDNICEYKGLSHLPDEISGLKCLTNLHLSDNTLDYLPDGIGQLKNLVTLKVDKNNLTELNSTIGGCVALQELVLTSNGLKELPPTIGLLSDLRTLNVDENKLSHLTSQIGSLKKLGILSLRDNKLVHLPSEIGNLQDLRVLDLADNILEYLPWSFTNLNLSALWLSTNQAQPLLKLQTDELPTGIKVLTCYLLPQINDKKDLHNDEHHSNDSNDEYENTRPAAVKFDNEAIEDNEFNSDVQFVRHDTPHPKELKARHQRLFGKDKVENHSGSDYTEGVKQIENGTAMLQFQDIKHKDPSSNFAVKDSVDHHQVTDGVELGYNANGLPDIPLNRQSKSLPSMKKLQHPSEDREDHDTNEDRTVLFDQSKHEFRNQPPRLQRRDTPHHLKNQQVVPLSKEDKRKIDSLIKDRKKIIYIDVYRTDPGIGLSIAGGKGTPPFKDDDEGIFVSRVTPKGPTEAAGVKVKDKILAVNDKEFYEGIDHASAVEIFKKVKSNCNKFTLKVLRDEADQEEPRTKDEVPTDSKNNSTNSKKQNTLNDNSFNNNAFVRSYSIPDAPTGNRAINNLRQSLMATTATKNTDALPTNMRASCRDGRSVAASLARGMSLADSSSSKPFVFTTLVRDKQGGLGLGIEGGADSGDYKSGSSNVTITSIKPDSVAAKDGKLQPNDRIITINGTDVASLDHERVVALLNSSDRFVRIVVARGESDDPIDVALRSMPARPPLGSWFPSSSYMAHRPSFTGSYRRPTFGSVSSLASGDVSLNIHNMANSSAAIPGMVPVSQARSNSVHTRLQGLRSQEPAFLPRPKPINLSSIVDGQQPNGKSSYWQSKALASISQNNSNKNDENRPIPAAIPSNEATKTTLSLQNQFPPAPTTVGVFTESLTKSTFTETTTTRVTRNDLATTISTNSPIPSIDGVDNRAFSDSIHSINSLDTSPNSKLISATPKPAKPPKPKELSAETPSEGPEVLSFSEKKRKFEGSSTIKQEMDGKRSTSPPDNRMIANCDEMSDIRTSSTSPTSLISSNQQSTLINPIAKPRTVKAEIRQKRNNDLGGPEERAQWRRARLKSLDDDAQMAKAIAESMKQKREDNHREG